MANPYLGDIRMMAANFAPRNYAFCNGILLAITENQSLFSLLGTMYGGNGITTFGLPDMRGRIPVGAGQGPGLTNRIQGSRYGLDYVTLNDSQMPVHNHELIVSNDDATSSNVAGRVLASTKHYMPQAGVDSGQSGTLRDDMIDTNGGGWYHDNMMPFQCLSFIIAMNGVYPPRN